MRAPSVYAIPVPRHERRRSALNLASLGGTSCGEDVARETLSREYCAATSGEPRDAGSSPPQQR
ncbi:hypothetical protein IMZ48_00500 [Candidatus Bathyarchaeota archaeon]|nr:hypothetical protein [Candidatus Bathyarchaeota archaeon]